MSHKSLLDELQDLDTSLKGLSDSERREKIQQHRERLMGIVRIMVRDQIHNKNPLRIIPGLGGISSELLSHGTTLIMKFFGFDPFEWFHFTEYRDHNASFADRTFSNPSIYDAIEKAGAIFINKNSGHINHKKRDFSQEVNTLSDSNRLADSIISFCQILTALHSGQIVQLILNANEVRVVLAHVIEAILENSSTRDRIQEKISKPLVVKGQVAWVRYEFSSKTSIEESCCTKNKRVDVDVKMTYFAFPSEADFRVALRNVEEGRV